MSISNMLRNVAGELEIGRTLLAFGGFNAIFSPTLFEGYAVFRGAKFDIEQYCLALSACLVALAPLLLSIGKKEQNVESARATATASKTTDGATQ